MRGCILSKNIHSTNLVAQVRSRRVSWFTQDLPDPEAGAARLIPRRIIGQARGQSTAHFARVWLADRQSPDGRFHAYLTHDSAYSAPGQYPAHFKHSNICWMNEWLSHWARWRSKSKYLKFYEEKLVQVSTTFCDFLKTFNLTHGQSMNNLRCYNRQWSSHHAVNPHTSAVPDAGIRLLIDVSVFILAVLSANFYTSPRAIFLRQVILFHFPVQNLLTASHYTEDRSPSPQCGFPSSGLCLPLQLLPLPSPHTTHACYTPAWNLLPLPTSFSSFRP